MGWIFLLNYANTKDSINNLLNLVKMLILGIETSCDETAAAVVEGKSAGTQNIISVRSNIISSQVNIHKKYGGVVPEVAAREHVLQILPVVNAALEKAGIPHPIPLLAKERVPERRVRLDAIAVTIGPGLITSLQVGIETAKVLSYVWQIPAIAINHIEGHIYANFINRRQKIKFPVLILTVSGGHTMLILMKGHGKYKIIGKTRDDAAGEAFDKAARLLGLKYPGGPIISAYAEKFQISNHKSQIHPAARHRILRGLAIGDGEGRGKNSKSQITNHKNNINLPRPMLNSKNYDFSFSGLKTALMYELKKDKYWKKKIPEYCHEFQQAIIDVLISKTIRAAKEFEAKTVILTGGVAANKKLRIQLKEVAEKKIDNVQFIAPDLKYTADNAAMVATAGYYHAMQKDFMPWQKLKVDCNPEL